MALQINKYNLSSNAEQYNSISDNHIDGLYFQIIYRVLNQFSVPLCGLWYRIPEHYSVEHGELISIGMVPKDSNASPSLSESDQSSVSESPFSLCGHKISVWGNREKKFEIVLNTSSKMLSLLMIEAKSSPTHENIITVLKVRFIVYFVCVFAFYFV